MIEKPRKTTDCAVAYRPICLLDECGKLYEKLINERLKRELMRMDALSDSQYGFRQGRSTVDALERVRNVVRFANTGALQRRDYCLLITLDVRNVFNSASWAGIVGALNRMKINKHLIEVIKSYLSDRMVLIGDSAALEMTCGVPPGTHVVERLL